MDLPMPGSPPSRMRLPGTMPPPNTRLSSVSPVSMRGSGRVATCRSGLTVEVSGRLMPAGAALAAEEGETWSCLNEFQAPQEGHFPTHFGESCPHCSQT